MLLKLGLALCIVAAAQADSCMPDASDKVSKCTTDFVSGLSSHSTPEGICGALKRLLCCISNAISTCDANSQKRFKDGYKAQMKQISGSVKQLSQCNIDIPNALDQAQTRCAGARWVEPTGSSTPRVVMSSAGTKWVGPTGSSAPRATMSSVLCLCMFLVLKVFL